MKDKYKTGGPNVVDESQHSYITFWDVQILFLAWRLVILTDFLWSLLVSSSKWWISDLKLARTSILIHYTLPFSHPTI